MKNLTSKTVFSIITIAFFMGISFTSCKKNPETAGPAIETDSLKSDMDSLKYFMYRTMQVSFADGGRDNTLDLPSYYWYAQVPKLDPLSPGFKTAQDLLDQMKTYAINPATGKAFDKYSFLDDGSLSTEFQGGITGDFGIQVSFASDGTNFMLYVLYADKNSPAGLAGIDRGWQITAINGDTKVAYDGDNGPNVQRVVKAVYNDPKTTFTFKRPDNTSTTITLDKANYNINPVLFDSVYTFGSKKIGYFVFNTFTNVVNDKGATPTKFELDRIFSKFSAANITSLIVDLRYNGGGSLNTVEYLDSAIAPQSAVGKLMYQYKYNDKMTKLASQIGLEEKIFFSGTGNLNLQNVFFIGGRNTASASELTLNNLKPYMDVKLVGKTTDGKPVGFFQFHLTQFKSGVEKDLADLYAINFETLNAAGKGGYFDGIVPDIDATDYINVPWGNLADDNLQKIFGNLKVGGFTRQSMQQRMSKDPSLRIPVESKLENIRFDGMVDFRGSKLLKNASEKRNLTKTVAGK